MAVYRVESIEALGPKLEAWARRAIPIVYEAIRAEIAEQAMILLVDLSPVGNPAVDPHPGKYRASHTVSHGEVLTRVLPDMPAYPTPGIPEVQAGMSGADPGASVFIANAAAPEAKPDKPYAALLEPGRRMYSRMATQVAQWIGSEQAPEGIYGPAVVALRAMRATIVASALKRAKARL